MPSMKEKSIWEKIKEAGSHTVIYGTGSAIQAVLGFLLIPLYTKYYTTDVYGVLALLTICATLAGSVFYFGASSALARSYYDYEEGHERKKTISTSLFITLLGALIQGLLGFAFRGEISQALFGSAAYSPHVAVIMVSSALTFINQLFYLLLRYERKSRQVIAINFLFVILSASLIIFLLVQLEMGVMAPILGDCITQAVLFAILLFLNRRNFVPEVSGRELNVQIRFGIPTVLAGLGYYILSWSDRFFINEFCSLGDVGVYALGYKFGTMIHVFFIMPFSQIWAPMRMEYRNDSNAGDLYKLILTYYFIIGIVFTVTVSIFAREILAIISSQPDYVIAYRVVPFIMMGHLMYGVINIIDYGIYFKRKMFYHAMIFWSVALLNMGMNYLLIPRLGYMAAAYNAVITYFLMSLLVFVVSHRLHPMEVDAGRLSKLFAASLPILMAGYWLAQDDAQETVWMKVGLVVLQIAILFLFVFNKDEKERIRGLIGWRLSKS